MVDVLDLSNKTFLKTLRMLRIMARRFFRGQKIGARLTKKRGSSVEFSDYKEYNPGDDIRFIDWNIYGRLDRLLIKLYFNEENLSSYIFVDCSTSMRFGEPSKFDYARRLAAAIAYIGACNNDSVRIICFGNGLQDFSPKADRAAHVLPIFRYIESREAEGRSDFDGAVQEFLRRFRRPGVVFVLSDLFVERRVRAANDGENAKGNETVWTRDGALESGLKRLVYYKHDVNLVHCLTPEELNPPYSGLWEFTDSESGEKTRLYITDEVLRAYREALDAQETRVLSFCKQNRVNYMRTATDVPFENMVLRLFGNR